MEWNLQTYTLYSIHPGSGGVGALLGLFCRSRADTSLVEAWERSWDCSVAHGPPRRLLCQSQCGGTPTGRDARRGPCFFRHRLPRPLRLICLDVSLSGSFTKQPPAAATSPIHLCRRRLSASIQLIRPNPSYHICSSLSPVPILGTTSPLSPQMV